MKELELRKKIINLNEIHLSRFKSDLFDEDINLMSDEIEDIKYDIKSILELIPLWIKGTYEDEEDVRKYYYELKKKLEELLIEIGSI